MTTLENFNPNDFMKLARYMREMGDWLNENHYEKIFQMKTDKRKFNGGARPGAGQPKLPDEEKKTPVAFQIKKKYIEKAREIIQPIVDKINAK